MQSLKIHSALLFFYFLQPSQTWASFNSRPKEKQVYSDSKFTNLKSIYSFEKTIEIIKAIISEKKLILFALIDHADQAKKAGENLNPTYLIIFGNPAVGSLLMQQNQFIGLDLPLKILVTEDDSKTVHVSYKLSENNLKDHVLNQSQMLNAKKTDAILNDIGNKISKK